MITRIKLHSFKSNTKLEELVSHLENVSEVVTFVLCPEGDAVLLEYDPVNFSTVYYYTWADCYQHNNPILVMGTDCDVSHTLTEWDSEQLDLKMFTRM